MPHHKTGLFYRLQSVASAMAASRPTSASAPVDHFQFSHFSYFPRKWVGSKMRPGGDYDANSWFLLSSRRSPFLQVGSSSSSVDPEQFTSLQVQNLTKADCDRHLFDEMRQRFRRFKEHKYLKQLEHYQALAAAQSPKFMVIACADSRVCPSNILGFEPGEAFMIRNVANIFPPLENGPSETNAALEFAVTILQVEHIFIIGHSSCAGIETLMSTNDNEEPSFVRSWVTNARTAKSRTTMEVAHLSFEQQCRYCEKESINRSMLNLLTYPWVKERVKKGSVAVHGGHYDFVNCTFEKWMLDFESVENGGRCFIKDEEIWS